MPLRLWEVSVIVRIIKTRFRGRIAAHPDRTELWRWLSVRLAAGMLPAAYCTENTSSAFPGVLPPPNM